MAKYVTIMDIARELGISKSTVSRALSGDTGNVKTETLQKILATADRMGYHRNELAVNFRQQSTHNIGIIIPEIVTTFYMTFINDAQAILRKQGYKVMIAISNENPEQERENILMMEQLRVDGILMSACDKEHNVDLYNKVIERGIPIVFFDRTVEKVKASQVHMDDYIMSFFMVEALLRKGYKHIIHIPGPAYIRNSYERLRGYRDALEKFHIEYQAQDVLSPALSAEEGSWVMERFLEKNVPFDAVFGFTETAVLGAKSAIQKRGLRIPEEVANLLNINGIRALPYHAGLDAKTRAENQYYKKAYSDSTACEQKTFYVRQITFDSQGGSRVEPQLIWTTYNSLNRTFKHEVSSSFLIHFLCSIIS